MAKKRRAIELEDKIGGDHKIYLSTKEVLELVRLAKIAIYTINQSKETE